MADDETAPWVKRGMNQHQWLAWRAAHDTVRKTKAASDLLPSILSVFKQIDHLTKIGKLKR